MFSRCFTSNRMPHEEPSWDAVCGVHQDVDLTLRRKNWKIMNANCSLTLLTHFCRKKRSWKRKCVCWNPGRISNEFDTCCRSHLLVQLLRAWWPSLDEYAHCNQPCTISASGASVLHLRLHVRRSAVLRSGKQQLSPCCLAGGWCVRDSLNVPWRFCISAVQKELLFSGLLRCSSEALNAFWVRRIEALPWNTF